MTQETQERFVGIGEIARRRRIERSTARRAIIKLYEAGKLPGAFRTPGGHYRIPERYIDMPLS
ncbi:MAG: hypothetical protein PHR35_23230 [Kiritimatiellae bacterium]|nr:hypothetical protein [Kiritimatiellia bacterium]